MILRGEANQTGEKGNKRVEYHTSCQSIVDNVIEVSERINTETRRDRKNRVLQRAFGGVIDTGTDGKERKNLFREYTDAYTYFTDLQIEWVIPTMQTLESQIKMTWIPQKEKIDPVINIIQGKKPKRKKKKTTD